MLKPLHVCRAFSLIELLVVIAILVILVGMLLPGLSGAREAALGVTCSANLHHLGLGVMMYVQGNADWLPAAEPSDREFPNSLHWFLNQELMQTLHVSLQKDPDGQIEGPPRDGTVLICPGHLEPWMSGDGKEIAYGLSYGANGTWGVGGRPDHLVQRRLSEFKRPVDTLAFTDSAGREGAPGIVLYKGCPADNFQFRHQDNANVVFMDGHVSGIEKESIPWGMENRLEPFWNAAKYTIRQ